MPLTEVVGRLSVESISSRHEVPEADQFESESTGLRPGEEVKPWLP